MAKASAVTTAPIPGSRSWKVGRTTVPTTSRSSVSPSGPVTVTVSPTLDVQVPAGDQAQRDLVVAVGLASVEQRVLHVGDGVEGVGGDLLAVDVEQPHPVDGDAVDPVLPSDGGRGAVDHRRVERRGDRVPVPAPLLGRGDEVVEADHDRADGDRAQHPDGRGHQGRPHHRAVPVLAPLEGQAGAADEGGVGTEAGQGLGHGRGPRGLAEPAGIGLAPGPPAGPGRGEGDERERRRGRGPRRRTGTRDRARSALRRRTGTTTTSVRRPRWPGRRRRRPRRPRAGPGPALPGAGSARARGGAVTGPGRRPGAG